MGKGNAGEHIISTVGNFKAEIIIISSKGLGKVKSAWRKTLGSSTSDFVRRKANCPVLICR